MGSEMCIRDRIEAEHVLIMFLFFQGFQPGCSYKRCSYKKKCVLSVSIIQSLATKFLGKESRSEVKNDKIGPYLVVSVYSSSIVSLLAREAILLICLAELDAFRGKTPLLIEMGEAGRYNGPSQII